MANYPSMRTTKQGLRLIELSAVNQKPLVFTRLKVGDGDLPTGTNTMDLTALIHERLTAPIIKREDVKNTEDDEARIRLIFGVSNETLTEDLHMKEVGVYAKVQADSYTEGDWGGYTGEELLFSYTNGGDTADYLPDKNTPLDLQQYVIYISAGNASTVTVVIAKDAPALAADLEAHINDGNAHPGVFARYVKKAGDTMTGSLILNPGAHIDLRKTEGQEGTLLTPDTYGGKADQATNDASGHPLISTYLTRDNNTAAPVDLANSLDAAIREGLYNVALGEGKGIGGDTNQRWGRLLTLNPSLDSDGATDFRWQLFFSTLGKMLIRQKINAGNWTNWEQIAYMSQLNAVAAQAGVVAGDVSNANAWWIKLGGTIPIIIQGVKINNATIPFPVAFPSAMLAASYTTINEIYNLAAHITSYSNKNITVSWKSQGGSVGYTYNAFWLFVGY